MPPRATLAREPGGPGQNGPMRCVVAIPARMASTRFPGKPLADLCGKPMLRWVVEAAEKAAVGEVVVATPDPEILEACAAFGARAELTRADHASGTDRIAELAERIKADFYVNVQGDEPLVRPETIRACAAPLAEIGEVRMASVSCPCSEGELNEPSVVKVVVDRFGDALYFSRYAIPFARNPRPAPVWKHIGIYAYRRDLLDEFKGWPPGDLERAESLEQLRFLENGVRIRMVQGEPTEVAVDTPEQAEQARRWLAGRT